MTAAAATVADTVAGDHSLVVTLALALTTGRCMNTSAAVSS
jgi:hypothetical protein